MYQPTEGDPVGVQLIQMRLLDYLMADSAFAFPGTDVACTVVEEGALTEDVQTPAIILTDLGMGETDYGAGTHQLRFILMVYSRGRGYYWIKRILDRAAALINDSDTALAALEINDGPDVVGIVAAGTTATGTYPGWNMEGQGLYVFITVSGLFNDHY